MADFLQKLGARPFRWHRKRAYREDFLTAVALLREPSEELVEVAAQAECDYTGSGLWESALTDREYRKARSRTVLTALAAKLGDLK